MSWKCPDPSCGAEYNASRSRANHVVGCTYGEIGPPYSYDWIKRDVKVRLISEAPSGFKSVVVGCIYTVKSINKNNQVLLYEAGGAYSKERFAPVNQLTEVPDFTPVKMHTVGHRLPLSREDFEKGIWEQPMEDESDAIWIPWGLLIAIGIVLLIIGFEIGILVTREYYGR